jgi:RimJ/RimL family protein N-acetyltransferase
VKLAEWLALGRPEVELGYALLPEFWGHGYATEAGAGALEHARTELGLTEVVAFTLPENQASLAVMQRLGFGPEQHLLLGAASTSFAVATLDSRRRRKVQRTGSVDFDAAVLAQR